MSDEIALEEEFARVAMTRSTLRRLLGYFHPHRFRLTFALTLELVWVVSMLVDPYLIHLAVDGPLMEGDVAGVLRICGLIVLNIALRAALTIWELRITTRTGIQVLDAMRRSVFDHVQRLSMRYFDRTKQGRIIARADRDVDTLEHLVQWGPIIIVSLGFSLVLGLVRLAMSSPGLTVWIAAAAPVVWLTSRVFNNLGFPAYRVARETQSAISSHVAETITGVRVVQAFCAEEREQARLESRQGLYHAAVMRGARIAGAYIPVLSQTFHALFIVLLVLGGAQIVQGDLTVGALLEFVMLLGFVLGPVEGLGGLYNESLVSGAAAERIFLLLDTEPEVRDREGAVDPGRLRGEVVFDHVSFAYDPAAASGWQLEDVTFRVAPGETVALVGHTGAGKTSIVNLVARFYEAQRGAVRIDGHDIRDLRLETLHAQMGMVLQENFLFAGSVLENLRFVSPGLDHAAAEAGFRELGCESVLAGFVNGLDTDVGERGGNLSEGERQIVCFVRALLADPAILILDEATSAVDTRTEALILAALRRLAQHQTTLVIAHRLSTIRNADRILVMEHGRLVEEGRHAELMQRGGVYARLYSEYGG